MKNIRVVELFAGVGGFRLGLDAASKKDFKYETVWNSQWEPGSVTQYASEIYVKAFGEQGHSCEDIQKIIEEDFNQIPNHDLLVGGFPCQDYSVARTLSQSEGISGKKGVLWWSIYNILLKKGKNSPHFLMLENVDRLLKSPSKQRGRDFAVMLSSLWRLGYAVEWRVVNAADYGFPQRRRRVFILGYKKGSSIYEQIKAEKNKIDWALKSGVIVKAFPVKKTSNSIHTTELNKDLELISKEFSKNSPTKSPFENTGVMFDGKVFATKTESDYKGKTKILRDVLEMDEKKIPKEFYIDETSLPRWIYLKSGKKEKRKTKEGFEYEYSEGSMVFPDSLDKPSRTIVTGEGGSSPSRFKHVVKTKSGKMRRLMPIELERLNMFPDNHTREMFSGRTTPAAKRAFIMGNALVVGVITELGKSLRSFISKDA